MGKILDVTGERYGRLVGIMRIGTRGNDAEWLFRCDCGVQRAASLGKVRSGRTRSCGCLAAEVKLRGRKHGECNGLYRKTKPRLYRIWLNMKTRCDNPKNKAFERYGARGIKVCSEWHDDFAAFREWALSNGYTDALSIDRIENDRGYSPANCRWATASEQARNRGGRFAKN